MTINENPFPYPKYVDPRDDTLLEGWDGTSSVSQDEFIEGRMVLLSIIDNGISKAVRARSLLMRALHKNDQFRNQWTALAQESPKVAVSYLARAAYQTGQGVEEHYGPENLVCACNIGERPETKRVKWPAFPTMFPELSSWLLSPAKEKTPQLFQILDYLSLDEDTDNETATLELFWEQVDLVAVRDGCDQSLMIWVRENQVRSQQALSGSLRIYALSTFLLKLITQITEEKKCTACSKPSSSLKACARCHCVQYCGKDCQVNHFPSHKKECKNILKVLFDRYNSDCIETDITSLVMSLDAFMFPELKNKVLKPLEQFAQAESERIMKEDRANIMSRRKFRFNPN